MNDPLKNIREARLKKISLALKKKAVGEGSVAAAPGGGAVEGSPATDKRRLAGHGALGGTHEIGRAHV